MNYVCRRQWTLGFSKFAERDQSGIKRMYEVCFSCHFDWDCNKWLYRLRSEIVIDRNRDQNINVTVPKPVSVGIRNWIFGRNQILKKTQYSVSADTETFRSLDSENQ